MYPIKYLKTRRGQGAVWALFTLALLIVVGVLTFAKVFPKLDDMRDDTFTEAANDTISGVETDFYDAVDLLRIAIVIVAIVAILGYIYMMRQG